MAKKITELPAASAVTTDDLMPIVEMGITETQKATVTQLIAGIFGSSLLTASLGISSSFFQLGMGAKATDGALRLANASIGNFLNAAGTANLRLFEIDTSNNVYFGTDSSFTSTNQVPAIKLYTLAAGSLAMGNGSTTRLYVDSSGVNIYNVGDPLIFGSSGAATFGHIRLPNSASIEARNAAGNDNYRLLQLDTANRVLLGENVTNRSFIQLGADVDFRCLSGELFIRTFGSQNISLVAGAGGVRLMESVDSKIILKVVREGTFVSGVIGSAGDHNEIRFAHSGSTVHALDRYLTVHESKQTGTTTVGTPGITLFTFNTILSGSPGALYGTDVVVTAVSTTTTGSGFFKMSAHYYRSGSVVDLVGNVEQLLTSRNHLHLTATLTSSGGNLIVSASQGASSQIFRWGCFFRTQEMRTGSAS